MELNPSWTFRLWSDADNRQLIAEHYPSFLGVYDNYTIPMQRVDAARLFQVHRFGGLYLDLDFACLKPFEMNNSIRHGEATFSYQYMDPHRLGAIANNVFAAPPQHPLFSFIIRGLPYGACLLYTSPSPRDQRGSRMPSSA